MDNPIEVMANDIEPLSNFQRYIRKVARKPSFLIKRNIVKYLTKKALIEFEDDYKKYYIENESKSKNVGRPYLIKKKRKLGILLIHGYMAAPMEVKELAEFLGKKGITVYSPRVKGHGTSPEDLAVRTYKEWIDSVDEGFAIINNLCSEVVVGGFSNGAGLALDIASRMKNVKGVFAVCPPLRLQDFSSRFAPAVDVWNKLMNRVHLKDAKMEFVDNSPENPHINYLRNPISGVRELERIMNSIESKLSNITMPSLIIQALEDPVVNAKGSKRIYTLLNSKNKVYMLFNYNRHGILLGKDAIQVHRAIWDFVVHL